MLLEYLRAMRTALERSRRFNREREKESSTCRRVPRQSTVGTRVKVINRLGLFNLHTDREGRLTKKRVFLSR